MVVIIIFCDMHIFTLKLSVSVMFCLLWPCYHLLLESWCIFSLANCTLNLSQAHYFARELGLEDNLLVVFEIAGFPLAWNSSWVDAGRPFHECAQESIWHSADGWVPETMALTLSLTQHSARNLDLSELWQRSIPESPCSRSYASIGRLDFCISSPQASLVLSLCGLSVFSNASFCTFANVRALTWWACLVLVRCDAFRNASTVPGDAISAWASAVV